MTRSNTITALDLGSLEAVVGGAKAAPSLEQNKSKDSWFADATHIVKNLPVNPLDVPDRIRRGVNGYNEGGKDYSFGDRLATGISRFFGF